MAATTTDRKRGFLGTPAGIATAVVAVLLVLVAIAIGVALFVTSSPAFFSRYTAYARRFDTLEKSVHRDLNCNDCHTSAGGPIVYRAALVGDFYSSLFTKKREPGFVKFSPPTRQACMKCHLGAWSFQLARTTKVPHPAHLRTSTEKRDCVEPCHKWTAHEEVYMQKHKSMPFSGVCVSFGCHVGFKPKTQCTTCHHTIRADKAAWLKDHPAAVQAMGANGCLEKCHDAAQCRLCHTTGKTPVFKGLEAQSGTKAIEILHARTDWLALHGRQALAAPSKCAVCHISQGECQDCHSQRPAFHGSQATWIGQHQKAGKDKARCLGCHNETYCNDCHDQFKAMK